MVNEKFINTYDKENAKLLPNVVSASLCFAAHEVKKSRPFRFSNYISNMMLPKMN